jgi:hypothetical protein
MNHPTGNICCEGCYRIGKKDGIKDFIKQLKKLWREKCKRMDIMSGRVAIFELECLIDEVANE